MSATSQVKPGADAVTFVVYDASVLYPSTLRDLLVRIAQSGLVQAKWSDDILDEMFAALRRQRPDGHDPAVRRRRANKRTPKRGVPGTLRVPGTEGGGWIRQATGRSAPRCPDRRSDFVGRSHATR
ncbi:hypothetical protein Ari01nite_38270 [Paractinoplanes rishiriensis]|uniref:PIN domain-containing protein n=1 Tax=Paractinoplanes rishiriensis TaxID=1050105 RepID=A0A919JZF8_9ACTN|nr:hypothetical protein Ari01nite_38270 [Actinoplanes rishiriensis]